MPHTLPRLSLLSRLRTLAVTLYLSARGTPHSGHLFIRDGFPRFPGGGDVHFGYRVNMQCDLAPVWLRAARGARIELGDRVFLNAGTEIIAEQLVTIGPHCRIGPFCTISDTNHHPVHEGDAVRVAPVTLGRNVWLGRGVIVLPGSVIGDHSVIAAGSVVSGTIPPRQVWRGNPAVHVKDVRCSPDFVRG
jgi:acetyltransferase-like isoleucine patch superfamily enzyme